MINSYLNFEKVTLKVKLKNCVDKKISLNVFPLLYIFLPFVGGKFKSKPEASVLKSSKKE